MKNFEFLHGNVMHDDLAMNRERLFERYVVEMGVFVLYR